MYIVLAGKGTVFIGTETVEMRAGSILYLPPLIEHQTYNTGTGDSEFYGVFAPSTDFSEMHKWEKAYRNRV